MCSVTFVDLWTARAMEKLGGVGKLEEVWVLCQEPPTSHNCSVWGSVGAQRVMSIPRLGREGSGAVKAKLESRSCGSWRRRLERVREETEGVQEEMEGVQAALALAKLM